MENSNRSYCQIMIGRTMTGLIGLLEIFYAFAEEDVPSDAPDLGARLVAEVKRYNYVPRPATAQYEEALVREYRRYLETRASGGAERRWRDPRKELQSWYPTILEGRCNGCGKCLGACPREVLGWDPNHTKVLVLEPYECAPGCEMCARACTRGAIIMPARAALYQRVEPGARARPSSACDGCDAADCKVCAR